MPLRNVVLSLLLCLFFFFNDTATTEIYTLSLHDALPISAGPRRRWWPAEGRPRRRQPHLGQPRQGRSEEHTSELQSPDHLVCRLLLEKKKSCRIHASNQHQKHNHPDFPALPGFLTYERRV